MKNTPYLLKNLLIIHVIIYLSVSDSDTESEYSESVADNNLIEFTKSTSQGSTPTLETQRLSNSFSMASIANSIPETVTESNNLEQLDFLQNQSSIPKQNCSLLVDLPADKNVSSETIHPEVILDRSEPVRSKSVQSEIDDSESVQPAALELTDADSENKNMLRKAHRKNLRLLKLGSGSDKKVSQSLESIPKLEQLQTSHSQPSVLKERKKSLPIVKPKRNKVLPPDQIPLEAWTPDPSDEHDSEEYLNENTREIEQSLYIDRARQTNETFTRNRPLKAYTYTPQKKPSSMSSTENSPRTSRTNVSNQSDIRATRENLSIENDLHKTNNKLLTLDQSSSDLMDFGENSSQQSVIMKVGKYGSGSHTDRSSQKTLSQSVSSFHSWPDPPSDIAKMASPDELPKLRLPNKIKLSYISGMDPSFFWLQHRSSRLSDLEDRLKFVLFRLEFCYYLTQYGYYFNLLHTSLHTSQWNISRNFF